VSGGDDAPLLEFGEEAFYAPSLYFLQHIHEDGLIINYLNKVIFANKLWKITK
jgi:hypothetical protein